MPLGRRLFATLALLSLALPAHATQVIPMDTRELVRTSSDIVVGSVEHVHSYWNAAHTRILTDVTFHVGEAMKGAGGDGSVTITQMGGVVDGMRLSIAGSPVFTPGEEALLFLWTDARGRRLVNGLAQGKFDIDRDPVSGEAIVRRNLDGLTMLDLKSGTRSMAQTPPERVRLSDFKREIAQVLREAGR